MERGVEWRRKQNIRPENVRLTIKKIEQCLVKRKNMGFRQYCSARYRFYHYEIIDVVEVHDFHKYIPRLFFFLERKSSHALCVISAT